MSERYCILHLCVVHFNVCLCFYYIKMEFFIMGTVQNSAETVMPVRGICFALPAFSYARAGAQHSTVQHSTAQHSTARPRARAEELF